MLSRLFLLLAFVGTGCSASGTLNSVDRFEHRLIFSDPEIYAAWPAITRAASGDVLVTFVATEEHLGPDGAVWMIRSADNGVSWSDPEVLYDSPIDDREGGLTSLSDGTLIAHIRSTFWTRAKYDALAPGSYPDEYLRRWSAFVETEHYMEAESLDGTHLVLSRDDGKTWSDPVPGPDTIHGGIQLQDGSLLVAAYRNDNNSAGIYAADHPEGPWTLVTKIGSPQPDQIRFGEPHLVQLDSGRILVFIRGTAIPYNDQADGLYMWQSYSDDNGKTWVAPFQTSLWGYPPHVLQLADGRVLLTYGHRRAPFGQRAALSEDGLQWSVQDEVVLRDDATGIDLGYPVSLEIEPGRILTVYYQKPDGDPKKRVDIWATTWNVPARN